MSETILIGSLPPPMTGQTIAFQMVCEGFQERELPHRVIDLSGKEHMRAEGGFSLRRLRQLFKPFCNALILLVGRKNLYLSATQNWAGFLRDSTFILLAAIGRQRIVIHVHGGNYDGFYASLSPLQQHVVRAVFKSVDRILVLGKSLFGMFDFEPALRDKIQVVFNGLPYQIGETPVEPKHLPRGQGRPKLLFLSNLIVSKGYLQVLEALHILVRDRGIDAECHFCGSFVLVSDICPYSTPKEAEADFLHRIKKYGLGEHAFYHGPVDGNGKLRFLQNSHFFLLPTRYVYEGQPISIIEALAFGLVVITTPHRTIPEMVEEGEAAELIPFDRPEEIARVIEFYIRDPDEFYAMSRASINRYRETFTREQHLNRLIPLILPSSTPLTNRPRGDSF